MCAKTSNASRAVGTGRIANRRRENYRSVAISAESATLYVELRTSDGAGIVRKSLCAGESTSALSERIDWDSHRTLSSSEAFDEQVEDAVGECRSDDGSRATARAPHFASGRYSESPEVTRAIVSECQLSAADRIPAAVKRPVTSYDCTTSFDWAVAKQARAFGPWSHFKAESERSSVEREESPRISAVEPR